MNRFANAVFGVLVLTFVALNIFNLSWCAPISSVWDLSPGGIPPDVLNWRRLCIQNRGHHNLWRRHPHFHGHLTYVPRKIYLTVVMILPLPLIWRVRLPLVRSRYLLSLTRGYQILPHGSFLIRLCCRCSKHCLRLDRLPEGFHLGRQLYNLVQHLHYRSRSGSLRPANPHSLPQTIQTIKTTATGATARQYPHRGNTRWDIPNTGKPE